MKKLYGLGAALAAGLWSISALTAAAAPAPTAKQGPADFVYSCTPQAQQLVRQAWEMMYQGHGAESLAPLREAVKTDPACVAAKYLLGAWGEGAEAKRMAAEAFAAVNQLPEAERTLLEAVEAARQGDAASETARIKKLTELQPGNWLAHLMLSFNASYHQQRELALAEAKKAAELNPTSGAAWNVLGYAYVNLQRTDDAIAAFKKYAAVAPSEPNAHDSLGDALLEANKIDEAEAAYRKAIEVSAGKFYLSWSGVAVVRCLKTDWKGCRDALAKQKAGETMVGAKAAIDENVAWSYVAQGKAKEALKTLDSAAKEYRKAKSDAAATAILASRAWVLYIVGRHPEAIRAADAADKGDVSTMPEGNQRATRIGTAVVRAMALARSGKPDAAEQALTAVDTDVEKTAADVYLQALVAMARGEIALAKKDVAAAVKQFAICPETSVNCRLQLALAQDKAGDKEAAKATREALLTHPRRWIFYVWVRNQIDSKKVTKQATAASAKPKAK
ncbi:MAG: tetratricopeptide repeat protein [Deltaproteobacteria bacterium]|nr:tetratricopeptide repeat protein [Deltaproteobacteria bacterium]